MTSNPIRKKSDRQLLVEAIMKKASTTGYEHFNIKKEAVVIWRLLEPYHKNRRPMPSIRIETRGCWVDQEGRLWKGSGVLGHADYEANEIMLKPTPDWGTLAHELVHMAVGSRWKNGQQESHDRIFYNCLRDVAQRRFKCRISFYEVTRYGYIVDQIIERQLFELGVYKIFEKKARLDTPTRVG